MLPLGLLRNGEQAEIAGIKTQYFNNKRSANCETPERIKELGLRPGKKIKMLHNSAGHAIVIGIDHSRIAIDRHIAMKIMVTKENEK